LELGLFHPSLGSATFDGSLSLGASLSFKDGSFKGSMNSRIENSRIEDELNGVVVEKLNAEFSIDDILKMKSPPKQKISFLRASFGNLYVNDGKIDFQLESPDSIFIEKSSFKWCGGHLYTHAMRVAPGKDDYEMTLFCDRLKLVSLLEQLGVGKASGNGAVNGRLPLTFKNGRLDFQDGFLYSSPGEGGSIKLIAGDSLMSSVAQGLSENDPRMTQLELVKEALKDFEYEWAKLSLNTVKEDLKMHMVFDGKPSKPLPFRYSKETGGWLKVEANAEGSLFQGIKLVVNYKVPLAKLMGYGRGMKEIINKIK
jgi:predicted RNA-binding protein